MKRILLLSLLLLPIVALAQYPTFSNKQRLGVQTTGDGLIFRGNSNPNYNPSNINNAYFYLDTTTSKLYLYSATAWQQVYPTASDTLSLGAYLLKSDTLSMLLPYLRKSDTISLSNRINNKLNTTDTVSLSNRINLKLNKTDTITLSNRIDLKLNKSDTISLSNRIDIKLNASDTISLSNRINTKLNSNDTINLSNRINKKLDTLYVNYQTNVDLLTNKDTINIIPLEAGSGINITNNVISLDTTLLDSVVRVQNVYVKNGTGTVLNKGEAVYVTGANGTNIIVGRASNVAESSSSKTLGLTMTSIPIDGFGYVIKEGLIAGLNTSAADSAGVPIWLSNIPGGLIFGLTNKPYAPNHLVYLGVVTRKQQNNGEVYVTVQNGFEIKELHDVQILNPVNKASLYYNLSENLWRDTTAALLVSDTATMLNPYLRKLDTITLSNRIDLRVKYADTISMLAPYFKTGDTTLLNLNSRLSTKLNLSDTASMLSKYVNTYFNQTGINGDKTFNNVVTIDSATVTGKLLVNTNISDAVKIISNTNSTNLELMNTSGTVSIKSSNKNMILQTDTTALVYLNGNNKKVGILTMEPQQELQVNGNVRITGLNNNFVPTRITGSDNNGDLTNVNLGQGLSFSNDTLKVDLTIIDTAIAASSITLVGNISGSGSINSTVNTTINNGVVTNDMLAGSISDTKLNTITTAGKVDNSATTATSANTGNTIVSRDGSGNFSAGTITASLNGNANTATTLATGRTISITGDLTYTSPSFNGSSDVTAVGTLANTGVAANTYTAATVTVDAKGRITSASSNTIPTVNNGTLTMNVSGNGLTGSQTFTANQSNNATYTVTSNATNVNTPSTIVYRDASGNFSAGSITASSFLGNATSSTNSTNTTNVLNYLNSNEIFKFKSTNATNVSGQILITTPGTDFTIARNDAAQTFAGTQTFNSTINGNINGNAATVTTNANLTGDVTSTGNTTSIATGVIVDADINASAAIAVSKLAASTISGVTLGNNLNTLTISSPLTGTSYNGSSAVTIGIQAATTSVAGSMSAADKSKLDGIAAGAQVNVPTNLAQGTRTTTTVPITSSTGTTATLDIATTSLAGVMSSADKAKLDGIASGATANTGTVTSVAALTLTTTGTDVSSSVATGTTTPVITLNIPNASSTNRGVLTSTDWNTFNNKQSQINGTGFVKASGTSISYDNTSYLALTGGTLTGALSGTSGTFTGLNVNNSSESILGLQPGDNNLASRIQFKHFGTIRQEIIKPNSTANLQFRSYPTGTATGGYEFYVSNGSVESLAATIATDKSLSLTGTLGVTGATTLGSTLAVTGATTLSTTTATPSSLLGKDGSNVVGTVTTVAQTGLFGRGSVANVVTNSNGEVTITHGLGFTPIMAFANIPGSTVNIINVKSVNSTDIVVVVRDSDSGAVQNTVTISTIQWFAIK